MLRHNLPTPTPILPHNGEGVVGARPRPHLAPRGHPRAASHPSSIYHYYHRHRVGLKAAAGMSGLDFPRASRCLMADATAPTNRPMRSHPG